jgi:hypothetical protein
LSILFFFFFSLIIFIWYCQSFISFFYQILHHFKWTETHHFFLFSFDHNDLYIYANQKAQSHIPKLWDEIWSLTSININIITFFYNVRSNVESIRFKVSFQTKANEINITRVGLWIEKRLLRPWQKKPFLPKRYYEKWKKSRLFGGNVKNSFFLE